MMMKMVLIIAVSLVILVSISLTGVFAQSPVPANIEITGAIEIEDEWSGESWVTVYIEVDGESTALGRVDPKWTVEEVMEYIELMMPEIQAALHSAEEESLIKDRPDLVTKPSQNLEARIDELEARINSLELSK
jgi:hypothetical protein